MIPNIRTVSPVPPELGVAALWQDTLSDDNGEYDMDKWIQFLYAQADDPSTKVDESKGPAVCMSSVDFSRIKTTIEQLCVKIKCSYEQKKILEELSSRVELNQERASKMTLTKKSKGRKL